MDSFLWSLATSYLALSTVAGLVVLALIVGYFPLLKWVPIIGPYVAVARVVAFLAFGLLCGLVDRRAADTRAEVAQLRIDLAFSQVQLANQKAAADDKARLAEASAASAAIAEQKATNYETFVLSAPAVCPGGDDFDGELLRVLHDIKPRRARGPGGANPKGLRGFGERYFGAARK